jgi:thiamine kinase-like enzyme
LENGGAGGAIMGLTKIGGGSISELFEYGEETVLKLYRDYVSEDLIKNEFNNNLLICGSLDTAKAIERTVLNGRQGIVFERLAGVTMADQIKKHPHLMSCYARRFAEIHHHIHQCSCPQLPSQKSYLHKFVLRKNFAPEKERKLIDELNRLPDGNQVCHNDFTPDNIIFYRDRYYTIDWSGATHGDPAMDVAHTMLLLKDWIQGSKYSPVKVCKQLYLNTFCKIYLFHYIRSSNLTLEQIIKWRRFLAKMGLPLA